MLWRILQKGSTIGTSDSDSTSYIQDCNYFCQRYHDFHLHGLNILNMAPTERPEGVTGTNLAPLPCRRMVGKPSPLRWFFLSWARRCKQGILFRMIFLRFTLWQTRKGTPEPTTRAARFTTAKFPAPRHHRTPKENMSKEWAGLKKSQAKSRDGTCSHQINK